MSNLEQGTPEVDVDLSDLGIDPHVFDLVHTSPQEFDIPGRRTNFLIGKTTPVTTTILGRKYPAEVTIDQALLTRVTEMQQRGYKMASGIFSQVKMSIRLEIAKQWITQADFLRAIVNQGKAEADRINAEDFATFMRSLGMDLSRPGLVLWQHFRTSDDGVERLFNLAEERGWDISTEDPNASGGRILRSAGFETRNVSIVDVAKMSFPATRLEVGSNDRSMSQTGQGFVDFPEAITMSFLDVVPRRTVVAELRRQLDADINAGKLSDADAKQERQRALLQRQRAASAWTNSWSGAHEQMNLVDADGNLVQDRSNPPEGSHFVGSGIRRPVQAPIGRLELMLVHDVEPIENESSGAVEDIHVRATETETIDLWTTATQAEPVPPPSDVPSVAGVSGTDLGRAEGDETPY